MTKSRYLRTFLAGGAMALLLAGLVPSSLTAQDVDSRWLPWLGCWETAEAGEDTPLLCVRPAAEGNGVEFVSWTGTELSPPETILADGVSRNAEREDCVGMEEARFSDDGHRVYLKSNYVCEGGVEQKASGILAMVNPMEWVDIKSVDGMPWVLKYRLARASRVEESGLENVVASRASEVKAARLSASQRLTEDDVIEAVGNVDGAAVEALIVERGDPFAMDAALLVRLDDAGVPDGVIDLMVAVSYPDRFAVKAGAMPIDEYADEEGYDQPRRRFYMASGFYNPFWGGFGYYPRYYGLGYGYYGYSGYGGYGGYGYYGGYGGYGYYPRPIVVTPRTGSGGRMIKGQGYTRGGSGYTRGTARPRGSSAGSSGGARARTSPGVRSSGSSGRTAKPRGGGSVSSSGSSRSSSSGRTAVRRSGGGLI